MPTYNKYEPELKENILRLYLEEGRTKKALLRNITLGQGTITYCCNNAAKNASVLASLNGSQITASLAIEALKMAIKRHKPDKGLVLHSDQGSQFTSKEFNDFCSNACIQQSMSRAGCPYDDAPMERYYNTLNEHTSVIMHFKSGAVMVPYKKWT